MNNHKIDKQTAIDNAIAELFPSAQQHHLICQRTGVVVASINVLRIAGHVAYLRQWKDNQAFHPLFSLEFGALLNFCRSSWSYFCAITPEQAADKSFTDKQEKTLQIAALALLHQIADVDQTIQWLPGIDEVYSCWTSLIQLAGWRLHLDSNRFQFPALRISKNNKGVSMHAFLHDCWECKKSYETRVRESAEAEKLRNAEEAMVAIRDDIVKKSPKSKRLLWRWFSAQLPSKYSKDLEGWMWELYDAETDKELDEFTIADIDLFEDIFLVEIPTGSSISHAFLERLNNKRAKLEDKLKSFEIMMPQSIVAEKAAGTISAEMPTLASCDHNKVKFMIAMAKWRLAHTDINKSLDKETERQNTVSVKSQYTITKPWQHIDDSSDDVDPADSDEELPHIDSDNDTTDGGEQED